MELAHSIRYSIVIPFYNEWDSLMPLYGRLKEAMEALGRPFELVFVDDGSTDDSLALLQKIALADRRVTVVGLRQNAGKSQALSAGFSVARGDFIITMDGDLQHNPSDIPRFVEKLEAGFDIVCGRRTQRREGRLQRFSNRLANWVLARLTGIRIHDWGGGFKDPEATRVLRSDHSSFPASLPRATPAFLRHRGPPRSLHRQYHRLLLADSPRILWSPCHD